MRLGLLVTIDVKFEEPHVTADSVQTKLDQRTAATLYLPPRVGRRPLTYPDAVARRVGLDITRLARHLNGVGRYNVNATWLRMQPEGTVRVPMPGFGSLELSSLDFETLKAGDVADLVGQHVFVNFPFPPPISRINQGGGPLQKGFVVLSENFNKEQYVTGPRSGSTAVGRGLGELYFVATTVQGRKPFETQEAAETVAVELLRKDENATFYVAEIVAAVQTETAPVKKTNLRSDGSK